MVLKTPAPTDTELRTQLSPVPTHTVSGSDGSMATAPIDCGWSSKTGSKVTPPSFDFQTPPEAVPIHRVRVSAGPSSRTPSMAAMRPLVTAGPRARAVRPERSLGSRSSPLGCVSPGCAPPGLRAAGRRRGEGAGEQHPQRGAAQRGAGGGGPPPAAHRPPPPSLPSLAGAAAAAGISKRASGRSGLSSTESKVNVWPPIGAPLAVTSNEWATTRSPTGL